MMTYHFSLCLLFLVIHSSYAQSSTGKELVDDVCNRTSNYKYCLETVHFDSRSPDSEIIPTTLADIAFRLAYNKATTTQALINQLLKSITSHSRDFKAVQICSLNYNESVEKLEGALNDLNSETYDQLASDVGVVSHGAKGCQAAFIGSTKSPLTSLNKDMQFVCEICVAVSKVFTGGQL